METERQNLFKQHVDLFAEDLVKDKFSEDAVTSILRDMIPGIKGFDANYPDATDEKRAEFIRKIGEGVVRAHVRKASLAISVDSPENRAIRLKKLVELQESHHVHFAYIRDTFRFVWPAPQDEEDILAREVPAPQREHVAFGQKRGVIAFKYHLSNKGELEIEFALSYCSEKDRFDSLQGKEGALDRFVSKKTLTIEASRGALFNPLVGSAAELVIMYARDVMKANGVVREVLAQLNLRMDHY